jgi:hypothetical protein
MPDDTYNWRLNAVNIIFCLFNVVITALFWTYNVKDEVKAGGITFQVQ